MFGEALDTPSTATVAGSPYSIVPSAATGTGLGNYSISYTNGVLTVTKLGVTVTGATASNKTYDGLTSATITGATWLGYYLLMRPTFQ